MTQIRQKSQINIICGYLLNLCHLHAIYQLYGFSIIAMLPPLPYAKESSFLTNVHRLP